MKRSSLKTGEIIQRSQFYTRSRQTGETVAEFVVDLKRLAAHCKFWDTLETMLCDRIVCGIIDSGEGGGWEAQSRELRVAM